MSEDNKNNKKPYGINVSIVPGRYAPASMNVGITEEFAENLTKTVSELASKIALETYKNLLEDGIDIDETNKLLEMNKSNKHPLDAMTDVYLPIMGKVKTDTFYKLECITDENCEDFPLRFHRYSAGFPLNTNKLKAACHFYGSECYRDVVSYYMTQEETSQVIKYLNDFASKVSNIFSDDDFIQLHVVPDYAGYGNEMYFRNFIHFTLSSNYNFVKDIMGHLNKLMNNLNKVKRIFNLELRHIEPWDEDDVFEIVVSFLFNYGEYLDNLSEDEIIEKFSPKIKWWQDMIEKEVASQNEEKEETVEEENNAESES